MGVLQSVIDLRNKEDMLEQMKVQQIGNAVQGFLQRKQAAEDGTLDRLVKNAQLKNIESQITQREKGSALDDLIKRGKAVDAAISIGDMDLANTLRGGQTINQFLDPSVASATPQTSVLPKIVGDQKDTSAGQFVPKELDRFGNPTGYKLKEDEKGLSIETGGKLAMVKQAKSDITEARKMLFPSGDVESFDKKLAVSSNLPLLGKPLPTKDAQKFYSRIQNAVSAKLRVETGAQANPSEVKNILDRFGINSLTTKEAAWDFLNRLEDFMDETVNITDPSGKFTEKDNDPLGLR